MKKFKLTEAEINNIKGREKAMDYLVDIIKRDINIYLYQEIIPRLGLDQEKGYELSPDREWLNTVEPAKNGKN